MEVERSRAKKSFLARSRSKRFKGPNISKAVYGKEMVTKLSYSFQATASSGIYSGVLPLVSSLRASNDWGNYAASYQNFNILKVKIQYVPCGQAGATPNAVRALGICYTVKDADALTNLNQVADHTIGHTVLRLEKGKKIYSDCSGDEIWIDNRPTIYHSWYGVRFQEHGKNPKSELDGYKLEDYLKEKERLFGQPLVREILSES